MTPNAITPADFPWFDYRRYTFSLGLSDGERAWLSGHSASEYDPEEGRIVVRGGMAEQARTAYAKIERLLEAAGLTFADVTRVVENVTVRGIADYAEAEAVRAEVLGPHRPAVTTVCVNALLRPAALIEVEVTAARQAARDADGVVYLPSILPLDDRGEVIAPGDLVGQTEAVFAKGAELLAGVGLGYEHVVKTLDYTTPATLGDYKRTGRARRDHLSAPYPGSAGILMARLPAPGALIQLDLMASRHPKEAVNPGWERYGKLTYSPAVRAGSLLFMSGQAALDPETERAVSPGDVAAQAEYTYTNILAVLEAAGLGPEHLVKTVEYVTPQGLGEYRRTAEVRAKLLREPYPASTGIVCEGLLRPEFLLEIDPTARYPEA
jgi:enamine deaminase RidA (YjgF/YER057c/UK114 family)